MGSHFPNSPKLLKGALISFDSQFLGPVPNVIAFQYNPDQLTRQLTQRSAPPEPSNIGAAREDVLRVLGPPVENISLSIELDATDQLAEPGLHPQIVLHGLHPALAALELLLYPKTTQVLLNRTLARSGSDLSRRRTAGAVRLGSIQSCPCAVDELLDYRGSIRSAIESDSRKSRFRNARVDLHGIEGSESGLHRLHGNSSAKRSACPT